MAIALVIGEAANGVGYEFDAPDAPNRVGTVVVGVGGLALVAYGIAG